MKFAPAIAALALLFLAPAPAAPEVLSPASHIRCEEDMPCWDCTTMGNGICGLTPTENATELLESTTLNGQANTLPATS